MQKGAFPNGNAPFQTVEKVKMIGYGGQTNNLVIPSEVEGSSHFRVERTQIAAFAYRFVTAKIPPRASLGRDDRFFDTLKRCVPQWERTFL